MDLIKNSHIAFINLAHRNDRRNHMDNELVRIGLEAHRFNAIPWQDITPSPETEVMRRRTPGAIGCHFSQVAVMEQALELGKNALVMEDDIIFCSDFMKRIEYIGNWCDSHEWDVIWLGASFHVDPPYWHRIGKSGMPPDCSAQLGYDVLPTDDPRMVKTFGAYVTFAYIVNHKSIQKILDLFDQHLHTSIGIDWLFIKLQPQLNCFSFVPGCVMQMDNMSDIGTGMTVWSGQLNNGPYVFKDKMEDFDPTTYKWT